MGGLLVGMCLVSACSTPVAGSAVAERTNATAVATSGVPSLNDRLPTMVEQGAIPGDGMADYGFTGPSAEEYAFQWQPKPCEVEVEAERGYMPTLYREWINDEIVMRQVVTGYAEATGAEVLRQVIDATRQCATWSIEPDPQQFTVLKDVVVDPPEGVDPFLGYCATTADDTKTYWLCAAFFSHGNLLSCVYTVRADYPPETLDDLYGVLPRAVRHLTS